MILFVFNGPSGRMHRYYPETLTSGMVGQKVRIRLLGADWDKLNKTVVFSAGDVTCDVPDVKVDGCEAKVEIPTEVLDVPRVRLKVGVYGVAEDGSVMPTVWAYGPLIQEGVKPAGNKSENL